MDQEWMRFESTGSVKDYLAYSMANDREHVKADTGSEAKESEEKHGADHCTYRYGTGGDSHRGI